MCCGRAAEQLVGLNEKVSGSSNLDNAKVKERGGLYDLRARRTPEAGIEVEEDEDSDQDDDALLLGRSYFDTREYRRAAHALQGASGRKATFLRFYATYLVSLGCVSF